MDHLSLLRDLLVVFAVAGVVVFLFHRLRVPSVVGLLVAGVLIGPYGFSLIRDLERVEVLAEIGVVVLLFSVGLEFSLSRLVGLGRLMLTIGVPQVLLCVAVGLAATWPYFGDARPAVLVGMLLAMSSTAVVFKLLTDRGEMSSPHGNAAAAVLLFQDLLVVVCMVVLPLLSTDAERAPSLVESLGLGAGVIVLLLLLGRYVVPLVLFQVVRTQNRELFLIVLVLLCLGSAALTGAMGWSLALGAFLAGLSLSESEYATQTLAEVLPFRDTLSCLFFISVGMLLDVRFVPANLPVVAASVAAVVLLKFLAGGLPALLAGYPIRVAVLTGLALAQVGEFSFILAKRGQDLALLDRGQYQTFLATAVLTIALTPALLALTPRLAILLARLPLTRRWRIGNAGTAPTAEDEGNYRDHVVILGYGLNGRNLARVLRVVDIEYVVLELNPETVRAASKQGEPILYGDCTRPAVLKHLGVRTARLLVVAISDPVSARRAVVLARRLNPHLHIIVRTRHVAEVEQLRRLGANLIIPEEFETSVEIFARVLEEYDLPRNLILGLIDRIRGDHYEVLRDLRRPAVKVELPFDLLQQMELETCQIRAGEAVGRTVGELNLRAATGATLVAVRRGSELLTNPGPSLCFEKDDVAVLIGDRPQIDRALCLLDPTLDRPVAATTTAPQARPA